MRTIASDIRRETKDDVAADDAARQSVAELRRLGKRIPNYDSEAARNARSLARVRGAVAAGIGAVCAAALRRFSNVGLGGQLAAGKLGDARRNCREAAADLFASLKWLGSEGDGEDARCAGPLLALALEDAVARAGVTRGRTRAAGGGGLWIALEALLAPAPGSEIGLAEARASLVSELRLGSAKLASLAAATLAGDGGPRDLADPPVAAAALRVASSALPCGKDALKARPARELVEAAFGQVQAAVAYVPFSKDDEITIARRSVVALGVDVVSAAAARGPNADRPGHEMRADFLDRAGVEPDPCFSACASLRVAGDARACSAALKKLEGAATSHPEHLVDAGAGPLVLDVLRETDGPLIRADAKPWVAATCLRAASAIASHCPASRRLLATRGAVQAAVRLARVFETAPRRRRNLGGDEARLD